MKQNDAPQPHVASETPPPIAADRAAALQRMIHELLPFSGDDRRMLLETVATFFGHGPTMFPYVTRDPASAPASLPRGTSFQFSEEHDAPSPKAFILGKSPRTDVERVACLGYYLARYRGIPHFKTKDITALNTESAHRPFSNAAVAVDNATKTGYLVPSVKGAKQLSAAGEQFVEMLPDREAAREIFEKHRHRRGPSAGKKDTTKA